MYVLFDKDDQNRLRVVNVTMEATTGQQALNVFFRQSSQMWIAKIDENGISEKKEIQVTVTVL